MITARSTLKDVAFEVCTCLDRAGITAVLTGGSAATVYAPDAYQSADLDFVVQFTSGSPRPPDPLQGIGYKLEGNYYVHESNPLILEFPAGPLSVGRDLISQWTTLESRDRILHILTPTDCCRRPARCVPPLERPWRAGSRLSQLQRVPAWIGKRSDSGASERENRRRTKSSCGR